MQTAIKNGFKASFPIMLSYIPLALAGGVLAKQAGVTWWQVLILSLGVYGGSAHFAAMALILAGAGVPELVVSVLLIDLRKVLYAFVLPSYTQEAPLWKRVALTTFTSDEAFGVNVAKWDDPKQSAGWSVDSAIWTAFFPYIIWALGCVVGLFLGSALDIPNVLAGFITTAMFIGLLVPTLSVRLNVWIALGSVVGVLLLQLVLPTSVASIVVTLVAAYIGYRIEWAARNRKGDA